MLGRTLNAAEALYVEVDGPSLSSICIMAFSDASLFPGVQEVYVDVGALAQPLLHAEVPQDTLEVSVDHEEPPLVLYFKVQLDGVPPFINPQYFQVMFWVWPIEETVVLIGNVIPSWPFSWKSALDVS